MGHHFRNAASHNAPRDCGDYRRLSLTVFPVRLCVVFNRNNSLPNALSVPSFLAGILCWISINAGLVAFF